MNVLFLLLSEFVQSSSRSRTSKIKFTWHSYLSCRIPFSKQTHIKHDCSICSALVRVINNPIRKRATTAGVDPRGWTCFHSNDQDKPAVTCAGINPTINNLVEMQLPSAWAQLLIAICKCDLTSSWNCAHRRSNGSRLLVGAAVVGQTEPVSTACSVVVRYCVWAEIVALTEFVQPIS